MFKKDFNTLEQVAVKMADEVVGPVELPERTEKLEEEFAELMQHLTHYDIKNTVLAHKKLNERWDGKHDRVLVESIGDELGDVLFILLHISNSLGFTAFDLLHHASSKMLKRINDKNYTAKEDMV